MNNMLALDVGRKRTGVAFADARVNVSLPLETIHHANDEELLGNISHLVSTRNVATIVLGLPLLMNGKEGEEAERVRAVSERIHEVCPSVSVTFVDERETSKIYSARHSKDKDAQAATSILSVYLMRQSEE